MKLSMIEAVATLVELFLFLIGAASAVPPPHPTLEKTRTIQLREGLYLRMPDTRLLSRGIPERSDVVGDQILAGTWTAPSAGDKGEWSRVEANSDGVFRELRGYVCFHYESDSNRSAILRATGHNLVYVNGQPRANGMRLTWQPYGTATPFPIRLKQGQNHFVFLTGGIDFSASLDLSEGDAFLDPVDVTLPDLVVGEKDPVWAAVVVLNLADRKRQDLVIEARRDDGKIRRTTVRTVAPISARKAGFQIVGPAPDAPGTRKVMLRLLHAARGRTEVLDQTTIELRVRSKEQSQKRTFISSVDGSVQYFAVNPPSPLPAHGARSALVLSLHGAGVEAINQADSYSSKSWAYLVAPTNRRPYGFNWESLGRVDAMEVLDLVQKLYHTDPQRAYLTGHSMGGHGTWHVGQTYPDRFAAIAPSAGWIRMGGYRGRGLNLPVNPTPLQRLLYRPGIQSENELLVSNHDHHAVYILHGGVDESVPISHARRMNQLLSQFHNDLVYHEQSKAGHWWDASEAAGVDCVDWMPMFQLFSRRMIPDVAEVRQVKFKTSNPRVSSKCDWVSIEDQVNKLELSSVDLRCDPSDRRFTGSVSNVSRMSLDLSPLAPGKPFEVILDGQKISDIAWPTLSRAEGSAKPRAWLSCDNGKWSVMQTPSPQLKGPHRYGPFGEVFRNRVLFVYGTSGTEEENQWSLSKARFDAEDFWVNGNGSIDVVADVDFDPSSEPDRNVVLYGNRDCNSAWKKLLSDSPIQIERGRVQVGSKMLTGDDLVCCIVRPRPGSNIASVAEVAASGQRGRQLTYRLRYMRPGIDYPDFIVMSGSVDNVKVAGYFGSTWSLESAEVAWAE